MNASSAPTLKVSVLLPTRNGGQRVRTALESVLRQDLSELECVVVDDGSTDDTVAVVQEVARRDQRVRLVSLGRPVGLQRALNTGLRVCGGEFVARIDDDDVWVLTDKLSRQVAAFEREPTLVLLGTGAEIVSPSGDLRYVRHSPVTDDELRGELLSWNPFVHSSVCFRRSVALRCGGYDETMRHCEDHDLWLKLGSQGRLGNLPVVAVRYVLSTSVSRVSRRLRTAVDESRLLARYWSAYPNRSKAMFAVVARLGLHLLPLSHRGRMKLRARRSR